jgi:hypothetical protein
MSRPLIILVGLIYAYIAAETCFKGNYGLAIMYGAYAVANVGAWLLAA